MFIQYQLSNQMYVIACIACGDPCYFCVFTWNIYIGQGPTAIDLSMTYVWNMK